MPTPKPDVTDIQATFDIRVETLANYLVDQTDEFSVDQVLVEPIGQDRRRSEEEVRTVRRKSYPDEDVLHLRVNQKGIFDTLPQGLFIKADPRDYNTPIKRTRAIQRQIREARKFFLPFEQAIYHPLLAIDRFEQRASDGFPDFVVALWGLDAYSEYLDERQTLLLCHLLPEAQRIVGDWQLTELLFQALLRKPVSLIWREPSTFSFRPLNANGAEDMFLGMNTVLGDEFVDDSPTLEVQVRGVTYNELESYLSDGHQRYLLENLLYNYFLPLEVHVVTSIFPTDDAWTGELERSFLGANAILE